MIELTVVAFDPGETTGVCIMSTTPDDLRWPKAGLQNAMKFKTSQIDCTDENRGVNEMLAIAAQYPFAAIVMEDFIIDFKKIDKARHTLAPVRITAKFEFGMNGLRNTFFLQLPGLVKPTCTDERLKIWGLYDRNSGRHARDATRHAYFFLRNCQGDSLKAKEKRWQAWPQVFEDPQSRPGKFNPDAPVKATRRSQGERIPGLG
jgi:hypothetical protein